MHFAAVATMLGGDGMAVLQADSTELVIRQQMIRDAWKMWSDEMTVIVANGIVKALA